MRVLLYAKDDCGLCDAFHFELLDLQGELGFAYEKRQLHENDLQFVEFEGLFPVVDIETNRRIRLTSPTSQRQLRVQIRAVAALVLSAQDS